MLHVPRLSEHGDYGISVCLQWTDGPPPVQIQAQNGPTTSLASLLWDRSRVSDRKRPTSPAALRPFELRKESIILSSRLLHHYLLSYLNCYKTIPVIAGTFRALWRHGEAMGTQGRADLHHAIKVEKDSDVLKKGLLCFGLIVFPPLGTLNNRADRGTIKKCRRN